MNDNKPLIETSATPEITSVEISVETPLAPEPQEVKTPDEDLSSGESSEIDYSELPDTAMISADAEIHEVVELEAQADDAHSESFTCECGEWSRSVCKGLPFYKEHEGKSYCVLHYPSKDKVEKFRVAFDKKLSDEDFNFRGVYFPEGVSFISIEFKNAADFSQATFSAEAIFYSATFGVEAIFSFATFNTKANFRRATFSAEAYFGYAIFSAEANYSAATFSAEAYFGYATFSAEANYNAATFSAEAYFSYATFSAEANYNAATFSAEAYFGYATFSAGANFTSATFSKRANFTSATFSATVDFRRSKFREVFFRESKFKDYIRFSGKDTFIAQSFLNLEHAQIEKPERVSFHSLTLRLHWFINVDARKFDFTNVDWLWEKSVQSENKKLADKRVSSSHRLLSIACRNLALNAEENHRYEEASKFRYMAMEAQRLETWRGWAFWKLRWWYWAASGYGERIFRAFLTLIGVWFLSALLYTQVGFARWEPKLTSESDIATNQRDTIGNPLPFTRAMSYSFAVMALQKPEPRPATNTAHALVLFETVLGPLQAALLALAIRRKFMR